METGLIVTGRTQFDNNLIGDWLASEDCDLHAEWNVREGHWFFEEKESFYDVLEAIIDQDFLNLGIDARFEGVFN